MSKLSERFIQYLTGNMQDVTCFLTNGIRLSGKITFSDQECLTLSRDGTTQLIFIHALASVMPSEAFAIYDLFDKDS